MEIAKRTTIQGEQKVPGDKSITHRAIMISGISSGAVEIRNYLRAADCLSTLACMKALGVEVEESGASLLVKGVGLDGLKSPQKILDAGNSGTTLRLMTGLLAGQNLTATFTGDDSLKKRPLKRITIPLRKMGAEIDGDSLPLTIRPAKLHGVRYELPVASAQVKSAILLAGLNADSQTVIVEPTKSRDHTEIMLKNFGAELDRQGNEIILTPPRRLIPPQVIDVPNDISSAAFLIVLAAILPNSSIVIKNVGINPTRTGLIEVLQSMGADIELKNLRQGELAADVYVRHSELRGTEFGGAMIPRLIDEIPILAVAAAFAKGTTVINDVGELRFKESDRLAAIFTEMNKLAPTGFRAEGDSLIITGGLEKKHADCRTYGDHRLAMALAVFGMAAEGVALDDFDCVNISFPDFMRD